MLLVYVLSYINTQYCICGVSYVNSGKPRNRLLFKPDNNTVNDEIVLHTRSNWYCMVWPFIDLRVHQHLVLYCRVSYAYSGEPWDRLPIKLESFKVSNKIMLRTKSIYCFVCVLALLCLWVVCSVVSGLGLVIGDTKLKTISDWDSWLGERPEIARISGQITAGKSQPNG